MEIGDRRDLKIICPVFGSVKWCSYGFGAYDLGVQRSIQINFDPAAFSKVELTNVDLGNIGDAGDGGDVTFPDGSMVTFLDDATAPAGFEFNNGDNIAPTTPIALVSGATLVFNTPAGQDGGESAFNVSPCIWILLLFQNHPHSDC